MSPDIEFHNDDDDEVVSARLKQRRLNFVVVAVVTTAACHIKNILIYMRACMIMPILHDQRLPL